MKLTTALRRAAQICPRYPVETVPGDSAPSLRGERSHWETRAGDWISYPSAYAKKGRNNMIYVNSSRRTEVGADWLRRLARALQVSAGALKIQSQAQLRTAILTCEEEGL